MRAGWKNPPSPITDCHHSASLVVPFGDPRDGFFYLTLMMDTYSLSETVANHDVLRDS